MATRFALGDLAWNSADAVNTTYTVSGLPFQPKALMFVIMGLSSSTDAVSETTNANVSIGFATSTSDRRAVGMLDVDGAAAADTQEIYREDAVILTVSNIAVINGALDLNAINSDGFQLIVDDTAPVDLRVFWFAWGGEDIKEAKTGEILEPAATGDQDITSPSFKPDAVLFAGVQLAGTPPFSQTADAGMCFGAATGSGSGNQWVVACNSDEGSATMDTDRYMRADECLAMMTVAGGNPAARASLTQFLGNGFRINWAARAVTNRRYIFLAIRGGQWKAGSYNQSLNLNDTATVSGLGFRPRGAVVGSYNSTESGAGSSIQHSYLQIGGFQDTSTRRAMSYLSENGTGNAEVDLGIEYDAILVNVATGGTLEWLVDINAINEDGFQTIVDDGVGPVSTLIGYLACGDEWPSEVHEPPGQAKKNRSEAGVIWRRAVKASHYANHWPSTPFEAPVEPPVYQQEPTPGILSLRIRQAEMWQKAARPLPWGDFENGEAGAQEAALPYQGPIVGTTFLKASAAAFWQKAARPLIHGDFNEGPVGPQPDTDTNPIRGTGAVRARALAVWKNAATITATWFGAEHSFVAEEADGAYMPPIHRRLRDNPTSFRRRASRQWPFGDFNEGPTENQVEPWTQEPAGLLSLRRTQTEFWRKASVRAVGGDTTEPVVAAAEDLGLQEIVGVRSLRGYQQRYQAKAVTSSTLGGTGVGVNDIIMWMWKRVG